MNLNDAKLLLSQCIRIIVRNSFGDIEVYWTKGENTPWIASGYFDWDFKSVTIIEENRSITFEKGAASELYNCFKLSIAKIT